jgi:hypothetical protein
MSGKGTGWILPAIAVLMLGAIVWMVYMIASSGDEDEPEPPVEAEQERALPEPDRRESARQTRRPLRQGPKPPPLVRDLEEQERDNEPARLTPEQRLALRSALDAFYSPDDLADALRNRTAPDYAREVSEKYRQLFDGEEIDYGRGTVPMTPEVEQAVRRLGVVKDYVMNMLHTMRPEGQGGLQQEMMDRMNDSFGRRIDQLNADYPFLNVQLVDSI